MGGRAAPVAPASQPASQRTWNTAPKLPEEISLEKERVMAASCSAEKQMGGPPCSSSSSNGEEPSYNKEDH